MLRRADLASLPGDIAAGVTLGAVMVPVGLAFGALAGAPLAGLYAGILPLVAYALIGSSRQLIIGPDASMAALVAVSVAPLAGGDPARLRSHQIDGVGCSQKAAAAVKRTEFAVLHESVHGGSDPAFGLLAVTPGLTVLAAGEFIDVLIQSLRRAAHRLSARRRSGRSPLGERPACARDRCVHVFCVGDVDSADE